MSDTPPEVPPESDAPSSRPTTIPPSEPRPSRGSFATIDAQLNDRPVRVQMVVALVLGLVLVAIPLYLWRRPRAETAAVSLRSPDAGPAEVVTEEPVVPPPVTVTPPQTLACQDPGPGKTPPEKCDHLEEVETALTKAIEETVSCVPDTQAGTIVYVADVSFKRKSIGVLVPRDGRTIKTSSIYMGCQHAIKAKLGQVSVRGLKHAHARYKIKVVATYAKRTAP